MGAIARLKDSRDYAGFADGALAAVPRAEWIYLGHELVLFAADDGADLIAPFHAASRRVDCYTIRRADAEGVARARRLLALRADQITTDDPEGLLAALS
jgi:glycerophosphoryl diester phosphodiesterase